MQNFVRRLTTRQTVIVACMQWNNAGEVRKSARTKMENDWPESGESDLPENHPTEWLIYKSGRK
jgi:hypothetical protein